MLPLIISCSRSWNFSWPHLRRSTTESKNIVKHLAIRQTIHTCASSKIIFQRENLNYSIVCFTQCTLFFQNVCFLLSICLPYVICGSYVTKINAVSWHSARQTFASLGLFSFARIACLLQLWIKPTELNRPSPSSRKSHFQNEAKCETFVVKMSFICIIIKKSFSYQWLRT